jgi:hypothetical protein
MRRTEQFSILRRTVWRWKDSNVTDTFRVMIYCKAKPSTAGGVKLITMIAVGVGIAPMIHTLRAIFRHRDSQLRSIERADSPSPCQQSRNIRVKLLYGVVSTVSDYSDFLIHKHWIFLLLYRTFTSYSAWSCWYFASGTAGGMADQVRRYILSFVLCR